ncbi:hypothetical protein F4861DRAFT_400452 [Xylaria intraflava]|nr:hypothetical protein F4861DRAFT_400452 [Xylaria intraflava]
MGDPTQKLIDELCSLLDETTILSISSDYDLRTPAGFAAAREVLLAISKDVEAEEATGFNPSGFGGDDLADISPSNEDADSEAIRTIEGDLKSNDGLTTTTESSRSRSVFSGSSSKTSSQDSPIILHISALDDLSDEQKERELASMFVSLTPADIKLALQKVNGDADLAMDELLNIQWLEQTGQRPKGVDAFYVSDDDVPKGRGKGKGKRKGRKNTRGAVKAAASKRLNTATTPEESSKNEVTDNDNIGFISERFALPASEIEVQYQRNNFSLSATILEILDNYLILGLPSYSHPNNLRQVAEQEKRVPWIPRKYFIPIFDRAVTSQAAIEIIDILADHFEKPAYMKYDISYNIVAPDLELASEVPLPASPLVPKSLRKDFFSPTTSQTIQQLRTTPTSLQEASAAKEATAASTSYSFASASSAFRKGRSDPLMRQAAAFYADRGRLEAANHRRAISTEASLLVDQQSTENMIDLHHVSVQDGVDIALDRVWKWWNGLGEEKARKGPRDGLRVVTGLGRHNPDGKSPLRTRVFKALLADGWKFEVLTGAYLVTGRR